jgi:hypothetical protein
MTSQVLDNRSFEFRSGLQPKSCLAWADIFLQPGGVTTEVGSHDDDATSLRVTNLFRRNVPEYQRKYASVRGFIDRVVFLWGIQQFFSRLVEAIEHRLGHGTLEVEQGRLVSKFSSDLKAKRQLNSKTREVALIRACSTHILLQVIIPCQPCYMRPRESHGYQSLYNDMVSFEYNILMIAGEGWCMLTIDVTNWALMLRP